MLDSPLYGKRESAADDQRRHRSAPEKGTLESAEQARYLLEEVDLLVLLSRRTPGHVDAEEVTEERLRHMQRQAA